MEPIQKINYIKRRLAKVCTVPEKKSLNDNILDTLKRRLLSLKDSFVSLLPKRPENHMWLLTEDYIEASNWGFCWCSEGLN